LQINSIHKVNGLLTKSVIIATGATAKTLSVPAYDFNTTEKFDDCNIFWNHGVSACAVCDGALPMFRRKPIVVIGGGDSACEEATFLSKFASVVYMLVRGKSLRASAVMAKRVQENPKIIIRYETFITGVLGVTDPKPKLEGVLIGDTRVTETATKGAEILQANGLFFAIGHDPNTAFLSNQLALDSSNYIITTNTLTDINGVFACGDVQDSVYRQAITAAGTGCMAALECERYIAHLE
jgi:thioredoxin reductase (NADPH)